VAAMRPKFSKAPQGRHRELQGHSATGPWTRVPQMKIMKYWGPLRMYN
jgi:hypothetical protein